MWVRLDNTFADHPKIAGLSAEAFRLFVVGLCYASRYLTDGWVPSTVVNRRTARFAEELERVGLWVADGNSSGFQIHDYLHYQASRAEVEAMRKQRSEAGRKGAAKRWHT